MRRYVFVCFILGCGAPSSSDLTDRCQSEEEVRSERRAQNNDCAPHPACPHRGGYPPHDRCADRSGNVAWDGMLLPNDQLPLSLADPPDGRAGQGCDIVLGQRYFDAMSWDSMQRNRRLWEIKLHDWSNPYKYDGDLKACKLREMIETFEDDCLQIMLCNIGQPVEAKLGYVLGFSDAGLYYAVDDYFAQALNWENELAGPLRARGVEDDPRAYCTLENLQRCR